MADETELLAELGMSPEMCREVDLYWRTREDVFFVALHGGGDPEAVRFGSRGPRSMLAVRCELAAQRIELDGVIARLRPLHARGLPRRWY